MNKLSIIIPVFNEEKTISEMLKRVNEVKIFGVEKQIIVVNDGSSDGTKNAILSSPAKSNVKVINHTKNQGKGAAIQTGIENATGDYIVIQDADLEYNPKDIEKLVKPILDGKSKVVYGTRL